MFRNHEKSADAELAANPSAESSRSGTKASIDLQATLSLSKVILMPPSAIITRLFYIRQLGLGRHLARYLKDASSRHDDDDSESESDDDTHDDAAAGGGGGDDDGGGETRIR